MEIFFLSLIIFSVGGVLAFVTHRQFTLMKVGYSACACAGGLLGLYALHPFLFQGQVASQTWTWLHLFQLGYTLDAFAAFFLIPIFALCPLAAFYGLHYLHNQAQSLRVAGNFFCLSLLIITMALVVTADNMISFALAWEGMSLSSFVLVLYEYEKEATRKAGYTYLIFTQIGALFVIAAMGLAYSQSGSFALASLGTLPSSSKLAVFFLALIGFGSKAGVFPLHIWLPHAHPAAPSNISAVMSGIMIKMGIYGLLRFYSLLGSSEPILGQVVLSLGMVSGILGVVYALGKHDLKKLLAYHSVENIGIILIGAAIGMLGVSSGDLVMAVFGFAGCLLHVLNHALFKSLLFLGAGAVIRQTGTAQLDLLGGLIKRMPLTGKSFLIGSVSISGLPPFNGFISEFLIYYGAFHGLTQQGSSYVFCMLAILALAMIGGLAAACFSKVVGIVFLGEPRTEHCARAQEAQLSMTLPMLLLALACIIIGIVPEPFVRLVSAGIKALGPLSGADTSALMAITAQLAFAARVFVGLLLVCTLVRKVCYLRKPVARCTTWGCGFTQASARVQYTGTSYARSLMEFFKPVVLSKTRPAKIQRIFPGPSQYSSHVEDIAEAALVERLLAPILLVLGKFRWIQHGHIQLYIGYIALTIIVLLLFL